MMGLLLHGGGGRPWKKVGKSVGSGGSLRGHHYALLEDQDDETDSSINGGGDQQIVRQSHGLSRMKRRIFRAYEDGGVGTGWLETVLLGIAAIAQLYVPVVDMTVLGEMSAAESKTIKTQLSMSSLFYEDMDGVQLEDL